MYQRLQNWSQGSKSIHEYTEVFYKLLAHVDLAKLDEQLVFQYIGGLWPQIQDTMNLFDPEDILAAYQRALLIEKMSVRGSLGTFGRGGIGNFNCSRGSFANRGFTPPNGPSKTTTTGG
jgi:hypothetical protein